jgi:hypothetical protein
MDPNAELINEDLLRNLGKMDQVTSKFTLVVATDKFAMRGFDYRGKMLTLILARPFENEREAV